MGVLARRKAKRRADPSEFRSAGELLALEALDRSGLMVTAEGAFVRAIEVTPPNMPLLSIAEREQIAAGYCQLVSRLRPGQSLQFYVESRPIRLEQILAEAREEVGAVAGPMADDGPGAMEPSSLSHWRLYAAMEQSVRFHAHDQGAAQMRAIVLVPYVPGHTSPRNLLRASLLGQKMPTAPLHRGIREHRRAVQESIAHTELFRSELARLRLPARILNGEELAEILWARFSPTAADGDRRRAVEAEVLSDLDTPRSRREAERAAERLKEAIARSSINADESERYMQVDRDLEQVIYAATGADATDPACLMAPMLSREPFALSVFVHALDRKSERFRVKAMYRRVFGINRASEAKGRVPDFDRYAKEREGEEILNEMSGQARASIFRVAIYHDTRVRGPEADVHSLAQAVDHSADEIELTTDARVNRGEFHQPALWRSTLPLGRDVADLGVRYMTRNTGDLVPLVGTVCGSPEGIPFAFSQPMRTLERLDPWDRTHANYVGVVAGRSGSGKTHCANVILSRCIAEGARGFVIDRAGHYSILATLLHGAQEIELGSDSSEYAINPWDVEDPASVSLEKISFLLSLHAVMMGTEGLTVLERSQLAAAIRGVYLRAATEKVMPRESLLREELELRAAEEVSPEIKAMLRNLAERLGEFCGEGVYAYITDRETTVDVDAPLVVFDTRRCPEEVIAAQMFSLVEFIRRRIERANRERPEDGAARWANRWFLLADEFWHVLARPETGGYANEMARRSRHLGLAFWVLSQQLSDFDTEEGVSLLRNSTIQLLLSQQPDEVPFIRDAVNLSEEEATLLTQLATEKGSHSELFWINGTRGRGRVSLPLGPLEYWAYTSDPTHDVPLRNRKIEEHAGDVWAAIHDLAENVNPRDAARRQRAAS